MLNRIFLFGAALLLLQGCSSIPEVSVPNIPFISNQADDEDTESEQDSLSQLVGYKSRGDGYLSFKYDDGHLETIVVNVLTEEIILSKGQTVIKKLPVGNYSFNVSGKQKNTREFSDSLIYNGDTNEYIFNVPSPGSQIRSNVVDKVNLTHKFGILIIGSSLVNPPIEIKKLDQPVNVFNACRTENDTQVCGYSDIVTYESPIEMSLPEGSYLLNASGRSQQLYVQGGSKNTIEITLNGFKVSDNKR